MMSFRRLSRSRGIAKAVPPLHLFWWLENVSTAWFQPGGVFRSCPIGIILCFLQKLKELLTFKVLSTWGDIGKTDASVWTGHGSYSLNRYRGGLLCPFRSFLLSAALPFEESLERSATLPTRTAVSNQEPLLGEKSDSQMSAADILHPRSGGLRPGTWEYETNSRYDEVPVDGPLPSTGRTLESVRSSELAGSTEPLPPPPLPLQPPCGPGFYSSEEESSTAVELKPVRRFIPDSWKNFFKGKTDDANWERPASDINFISEGRPCSPPSSPAPLSSDQDSRTKANSHPSAASSYRDPYGGSGGSYNSRRETEAMLNSNPSGSLERHPQTVLSYSERVELYNMKYSYMKSWAGLLRILCVVELLLGAAVFACVCAYIHKDNEWYNMFGYGRPGGYANANSMYGGGSYYYDGPKTPFVLVVAGLAWLVTIILLALGMSMYYRTILLDSNWWPLTEFGINVALFILYLAAAIVYVNDMNRGGLCYYPLFNTPLNASFCRTEGGQTAAVIFLFVTMIVYLISAIVALKLWRHEANRRHKRYLELEMKNSDGSAQTARHDVAVGDGKVRGTVVQHTSLEPVNMKPEILNGHIPAGHIPKPVIMPDYVAKYPSIQTNEERDRYKAVFNDQFAEYKELHAEVQAVQKKFSELDAMLTKLPQYAGNKQI
ncbi:MARVEL domain-containing protein 2 [Protopterus annectens]|uniref:MARVEL domain-containing protein 2 n=1 Tax=Protopterus annectens TaxID=7888 RepID=UPI001CFB34EA|nr:MARVEL domain-containing protein 2 [Protopterus annectens]